MSDNEEKSSERALEPLAHEKREHHADGTSAKQVAANRRNAMRSTGPRTARGKAVSQFNAAKHWLRAAEVVIPGEDPREFAALFQELCNEWMPEGPTEICMVTEIAIAQWKLHRAHRAELGEIRSRIAAIEGIPNADEEIAEKSLYVPLPELLKSSPQGIDRLKFAVRQAMAELDVKSTTSLETCNMLDKLFGNKRDNPAAMLRWWFHGDWPDWLILPLPEGLKADKKAAAHEELELCLRYLDRLQRTLRKRKKLAREIDLQRLGVPDGPQFERLQQYETSIKRDMYRAIDQLERLQRRRRGEPPPPTVNVNVSRDDGR